MDQLLELKLIDAYPGSTDPEALAILDLEVASNEAFERALAAYGAHDYRSAARQFMAATEPILVAWSAFNGEIMAGNRLACYRNAQRAWLKAGAFDEALSALSAAAARDWDNAEAIQTLVAGLDRR